MNYFEKYKDCLLYIDSYWDKIIHKPTKKQINDNVIHIPFCYITPNDKKFNFIYYWDTFFMFRGLMGTKREWVIKDMVDNFTYLLDRYHIIPNFNSYASTGRSQPPFFSSMILDTYYTSLHSDNFWKKPIYFFGKMLGKSIVNKTWLKRAIQRAKREYELVWMDPANLYHHRVDGYGLSRYGDRDIGYAHTSELESGWDLTSRFYSRCNEFLPVDLNSYLYKYEWDFARSANILGNKEDESYWQERLKQRKEEMIKLFWNEKEGFFFDYGHKYKMQSEFLSLAGFTPLWTGIASEKQAKKMVKKLPVFETDYGLVICAKESLAKPIDLSTIQKRYHPAILDIITPKQWDYPNSWPPLEYLTVIGLLRYGFVEDAKRIMEKSVNAHAKIFKKHGTFYEKINGVTGDVGKDFHYPNQSGLGWTNAVFYRYISILDTIATKKPIYELPKASFAPYRLAIMH